MSDLVCISYTDQDTADKVLNDLRQLQVEYLVDLEDTCVVIRDDKGKVHLKQAVNLIAAGAASGSVWGGLFGLLVGILFMNPLLGWLGGAAIGAASGALSGKLSDYGINDDFISLGSTIQPGTSALFVLLRKVTPREGLAGGGQVPRHRVQDVADTATGRQLRAALAAG